MPYKNIVFNRYALADKRMAGDLTVFANRGTFLYFDERADFGVISYLTSIQIYKVLNGYTLTQFHVGGKFFHEQSFYSSMQNPVVLYMRPTHRSARD